MTALLYGFRIVGGCQNERKLVTWQTAFDAYCRNDPRAHTESEAYLSAFTFGNEFAEHLRTTGSTKNYRGQCWGPFLWFDIDREPPAGIDAALEDARRLAVTLADGYGFDDAAQLWFFSGSKGFHCGLPSGLWKPEPSANFHRIARRVAESIAQTAGVVVDTSIYDAVRAFRAPNSRHPKTGLHKVRLEVSALMAWGASAFLKYAAEPRGFEPPELPEESADFFVANWDTAATQVRAEAYAIRERRAAVAVDGAKLNKLTLTFIREGAAVGDRHRLLFSAAANLAECNCPPALAFELLTEAALDTGLPPGKVKRQIECGLTQGGKT